MTVVGIHKDASILENWIIPLEVFEENTVPSQARDSFVALLVAGGIDASRPALESVLENYPTVKLENLEEFQDSQEGFLDQGLTIINVMLGLAIVIALIGIANTIALSVFQRTRELGLVRAVGMNRTQLKQMIRWEAVVIAVFGAVIGMAVGVLFGYTIVTLLPDSVINTWAFPLSEFLVVLAAAVVCGIGAAYLPARRAAQLDVLDAIAHE
jgi:putative ABC transport system permease protein